MKSNSPPTIKAWLLATRPRTLPAAIAPMLVAVALGFSGVTNPPIVLMALALLCAISLQVLVNFANDYSDARSGVDTDKRVGPQRATQSGLISERAMKRAIVVCAFVSIGCGAPLIWAGGWAFGLLGALCIVAALAYSGGPFPLASYGLGEVTVLVFFGFVAIVGGSYLFTGLFLEQAWWMALISGVPISAIMLVNNTRDIETDKPAGKRTLAVLIGRERCNSLFNLMVLSPAILAFIAFAVGHASLMWIIAAFLTFPFARVLSRLFDESSQEALNVVLAKTAQYSLLTSVLFSVAILVESY